MTVTVDIAGGDTPATRCAFYRSRGLPAIVQPDTGQISVAAGDQLGAVTMPAGLGAAVRRQLHGRGFLSGPVISHPRSARWTFLVSPDIPDETPLFAEMFRRDVSVVRGGAIALPSPAPRSELFRTWVAQPNVLDLRPSGMAVIVAVRACPAAAGCRA